MSARDAKAAADPARPGFRLQDWPFFHLNRALGAYDAEMKRRLKAVGIDLPRWRILLLAAEQGPISISAIAGQALMELSTIMRVVQRLERDGLIELRNRPSDGRVTEATLTTQGAAMARRVQIIASEVFERAFHGMVGRDIVQLNRLLGRIHANLSRSAHGKIP